MGTVFSVDIRDLGSWEAPIAKVVAFLHLVDEVFSTYRDGSDISLLRRDELAVADANPWVAEILGLCSSVQSETAGFFTAHWNGAVDPTGLVKGWAIERASQLLREGGSHNHAVNGGGDVQLAGERAANQPWRVGISDPIDRTRLLTSVAGRDFAVATSGTAERGEHIMNPHTGSPAHGLLSATVIGPHLTRVDAYATAAFAMGTPALEWIALLPDHEALVVTPDGRSRSTAGFPRGV